MSEMQAGTEVVATKKDTTPARNLIASLANEAAVANETADSSELMINAITDIANATSEADLFAANEGKGTPSLKDSMYLIGVPLSVSEVAFVKSSDQYADGGLGTFVVVNAVTDKGEFIEFNTGAPNVVATLFKAEQMGLITADKPWRIVFTAKETDKGYLFRIGQAKV